MDLTPFRLRESVTVAAPPEEVWARVSDITRMGEVSPSCTGCEWDDPAAGMAAGVWFTGTNKAGEHTYSTRCEIDSFEPGAAFTFVNHGVDGTSASSRWGYEVAPADGGSELTETWELLPTFASNIQKNHPDVDVQKLAEERRTAMHTGINSTLAALKAELET
jgi:carbon monoxide dehydrogenase subunit G